MIRHTLTPLLMSIGLAGTGAAGPAAAAAPPPGAEVEADPYLWLEAVDDARSLDWVRERNAETLKALEADPEFGATREQLLKILDSTARIPAVTVRGGWLYNFWRDAGQVRGLWRRTRLDDYRKPAPTWEPLLDLDALAAREGENWVWKGAECLPPAGNRCLLKFSRGGGDAVVIREFDVEQRRFVDDGFTVAEAKTDIVWADADRVYVATDTGPGSLTASGYPRTVREWQRGTPLAQARVAFAGEASDVASGPIVIDSGGHHHELIERATTFFTREYWLRGADGFRPLSVPDDARIDFWHERLLITLRSDWAIGGTVYRSGSLLAIPLASFLAGERGFDTLVEPGPRRSLVEVAHLRSGLVVNELVEVRNQLTRLRPDGEGWVRTPIATPGNGTIAIDSYDADRSDDLWLTVADFVTPTTLSLLSGDGRPAERLKALPAFFDAAGLSVRQQHAVSKDGTRVPYFIVARDGLKLDGRNPTLLWGYGGFEIPMLPTYNASVGAAWLARGGVYVLANIRGGGEFGPAWHQAAMKADRQRAYDDFIAIAEDLQRRRITSPKHLGIQGRSNGGLLMGVMLTQRPDLFGAVVCQVPLLDMRRFSKLLAGASWVGEYGDPDRPEDWAWISKYSPYQNVRKARDYPPVLFTTSTRDDRVHPGHARKMAARMLAQGHDVRYYENLEGGHGGAANNAQTALMEALAYRFLWQRLAPDQASLSSATR